MDAKLEKKLKKALPDAFLNSVQTASDAELLSIISTAAINIEEIDDKQKADIELERAYAAKEALSAPYRDAKGVLRAKIRYCRALLGDRGKL